MLDELTTGDAGMAVSVISDFIDTSRADLRALREAAAADDGDQLRRSAHRVKGESLIVGATEVTALAQELENAAAVRGPGDAATIHSLIARLDSALAKVAEAHLPAAHPG